VIQYPELSFPKLSNFIKFVSATLEKDGCETDKRLTNSISPHKVPKGVR
jgi:hypothetical protein